MATEEDITQLLNRWSAGDDSARDSVAPLIYEELKNIARGVFSRENPAHTLQPTALVNEAYVRVTLHEAMHGEKDADEDVLALDEALSRLGELDERKASVLELHYFGGLTQPEMGEVLDISESTVRREFKLARIWLRKMLSDAAADT